MSPRTCHTLGDRRGRLTHLEVRCRRCERRGRLRLARLIAEHGADMGSGHRTDSDSR